MATTDARAALLDLALRFTEAFNRNDLDQVMSFFADDAVYEEFNGSVSRGPARIRAAFEPQFRGDFGSIRFDPEDCFADVAAGKVLIGWLCTLDKDGYARGWRGLDVLHVADGLITIKSTYAKAEIPLLRKVP